MTWNTIEVERAELAALVAQIRSAGGTITRCAKHGDSCMITYCTRAA